MTALIQKVKANPAFIRSGMAVDQKMLTYVLHSNEANLLSLKGKHNPDIVLAAIIKCAANYCGASTNQANAGSVYAACGEIMYENFGHWALNEIDYAFTMAALGKLEGVDLRAFSGVFTINILTGVCKEYEKMRKKYVAALRQPDENVVESSAEERAEGERGLREYIQKLEEENRRKLKESAEMRSTPMNEEELRKAYSEANETLKKL